MSTVSPQASRALTLDLLQFIATGTHRYAEAQETWRTSCPRLSIWEDACIEGLIECEAGSSGIVRPSAKGLALLRTYGMAP